MINKTHLEQTDKMIKLLMRRSSGCWKRGDSQLAPH